MVSIKDVARQAGVSPSTVSLVLNGSDKVKTETACKVRHVIEALHYIPNQAARSLVTREKKVVSMIRISNSSIPNADGDLFDHAADTLIMDMLPGVQSVLSQYGYSLLIDFYVPLDAPLEQIPVFDRKKIDGAIFVGGMISDEMAHKIRASGIPSVFAYSRHDHIDYIDTDPELGIYLATSHLISLGHTDIVFINGSVHSQTTELKMDGFCRALDDASLRLRPEWVTTADFTGKAGYEAIQKLWALGIRPTAAVCACDSIALGICRFLHEKGLRCPEDISIVGYESGILSMHSVPPMHSVYVSKQEIGAEAANILINRIRNPKAPPVQRILPSRLIPRASVAPRKQPSTISTEKEKTQ